MKPSSKPLIALTIKGVLCISMLVLLSACSKTNTPGNIENTQNPSTGIQSTKEPLSATLDIHTTPVPTITPKKAENTANTNDTGMIVFSMADGAYTHLFAYNPFVLKPTRLTGYDWDDQDPAISPDGTQIAFASDRDGQWDIYVLNLATDDLVRVTNSKTYDASPAWSPDGQYLIYETLNGANLDLVIQSIADPTSAPIQLTAGSGNNFSPSWSPDGRKIAFITDRSGRNQVWLADLQDPNNRFTTLVTSDQVNFDHPAWSPDGQELAWNTQAPDRQIQLVNLQDSSNIQTLGAGSRPVWSPDGKNILAIYDQPNENYLIGYNIDDSTLAFSPIRFDQQINSLDWRGANAYSAIGNYVNLQKLPDPQALFTQKLTLPQSGNGKIGVVALKNVKVDNAYLSDTSDESFTALRNLLGQKIGWDYLNALDSAYLPISAPASPGIAENWLFTGRAIAVNSVPLDASWMVVTREDFLGQTYWRVWLKCLDQTGTCGRPLHSAAWDFSSRYSGNTTAYENGGQLGAIPAGYWFDFSEFAHRFGWERLPAQSNWRYYLNGSLFNVFSFKQGETWQQAMLELYPPEALEAAGYAVK